MFIEKIQTSIRMKIIPEVLYLHLRPNPYCSVQKGSQSTLQCVCLHAEHIMRNAGWDDLQCGIKIDSRNINNLRYVDDTTLMAENKEVSKSFWMRVKEESSKTGLELSIKKLMGSGPIQFSSVQYSH